MGSGSRYLARRQPVQVNVSGRHASLATEVRQYAIGRMEQLGKFYDRITNVDIIIDHEKDDNHSVEMVAHAGHGSTLVAKHRGEGLMLVVDAAFDKLERQIRRLKDRLRHHRPHHGGPPRVTETPEGSEEELLFEGEAEFEKEL
jgi:putative sigma-54 modulation protein